METSLFITFFESNLYLFLFIIAILSQLWIPTWVMFFIVIAGSLATDINSLEILFIITLLWVISWDLLSYLLGKKLYNMTFFQFFIKKKEVNKLYIKTEKLLIKKWSIIIFISRFLITWIWPILNYIAWIQWYNIKKFILYVILWEILYVLEFLLLWYIFKNTIDDIMNLISDFWFILLLIFVLYIIWLNLFKNKKNIT